jgi:hypothetical protein
MPKTKKTATSPPTLPTLLRRLGVIVRQCEAAAAEPPQDKPMPAMDYFDRLLAWADKPCAEKTVSESSNA